MSPAAASRPPGGEEQASPDSEGDIVVAAVGDLMINRTDPDSLFEHCREVLAGADVTFGNCESVYSEDGARNPAARGEIRAHPRNAEALRGAGFDAVTFANNHHLDSGYDAFFRTLEVLDNLEIAVCGAGGDLDAARQPAVIECNGTRIAFLGYSSILFPGYEAGRGKPGCAPLRAYTHYHQIETEQPGSQPEIRTFVHDEDLEALVADVRAAKDAADVVVVSPHWGVHFSPVVIADYETEAAHAAIDAGADLVLGHHQHILKAVQVYRGKVIFHGMGNFGVDCAHNAVPGTESPALLEMQGLYPEYTFGWRDESPGYPFHPDSRRTMIARCRISGGSIREVSYVPCYIRPTGEPEALTSAHERFGDVCDYVSEITAAVGFDTGFVRRAGDVLIDTGPEP